MSFPQAPDPRAPNARPDAGAAYSDTILARPPRSPAGLPADGAVAAGPAVSPVSFAEELRSLPVGIQGIWVGLVCIVLMVGSAAALRSLFAGNGGAAPSPAASATVAVVAPAPTVTVNAAATAAPTAAATGGSLHIGGTAPAPSGVFGALAIRDRLSSHVRLRRVGPFVDDLVRLVEIEPAAIDRADVRKMIADVAVQAMFASPAGGMSPDAERLFTFLTTTAGAAGVDILFDLATLRGGSRACAHAEQLLTRPEIVAKGTPALQIANEMRLAASCQDRAKLFDRVKADGDRRVFQFLIAMARCGKGPTDCCMGNDAGHREVMRIITARK